MRTSSLSDFFGENTNENQLPHRRPLVDVDGKGVLVDECSIDRRSLITPYTVTNFTGAECWARGSRGDQAIGQHQSLQIPRVSIPVPPGSPRPPGNSSTMANLPTQGSW